jgi:hypothetical protein
MDGGPDDPSEAKRPGESVQPGVESRLQRVVDERLLVGDGHGEEDAAAQAGAAHPAQRHHPRLQQWLLFASAQTVAEHHAAQVGHRPHWCVAVDQLGKVVCARSGKIGVFF